jgi:hypothetical protein
VGRDEKEITKILRKGISKVEAEREREKNGEIPLGKLLRCQVRYFTDGAVIGSRSFVNEAFAKSRERFGPKRKTGARRLKGDAAHASGGFVESEGASEGNRLKGEARLPPFAQATYDQNRVIPLSW